MTEAKQITLVLDKERTLIYNNRAEYRMGTLERPFAVQDLRVKRRAWAALVAWVWACLSERDALDLTTPEAVALLLDKPETINDALGKFLDTYNAGQVTESKNVGG